MALLRVPLQEAAGLNSINLVTSSQQICAFVQTVTVDNIGHFKTAYHRSGKKSSSGGSDSGTGGSGGRQESGSGGKSLPFSHAFVLLDIIGNRCLLSVDDRSDGKFSGVKQSDASQKSSGSEKGGIVYLISQ